MKPDSRKMVGTHKGGKTLGMPHNVTSTSNAPWNTRKRLKQEAAWRQNGPSKKGRGK